MARKKVVSDINVTPLVDVMLVLLIIFMVTAPMMKRGIELELPRAKATYLRVREQPVVISVKGSSYFFNGRRVSLDMMRIRVRKVLSSRPKAQFVIEADRKTPFENVVKVMALLRGMGVVRVGIATTYERKRR